MTALTYAYACLVCNETGTDPGADLAARKHTEQTGHVTTTCLPDGPIARAHVPRETEPVDTELGDRSHGPHPAAIGDLREEHS